MSDERDTLEFTGDFRAGPMPDALARAVSRRRSVIRFWRFGSGSACVLLLAVVSVWLARPTLDTSPDHLLAEATTGAIAPATRLSEVSVFALRASEPDQSWSPWRARSSSGSARPTVFELRQRELGHIGLPSS